MAGATSCEVWDKMVDGYHPSPRSEPNYAAEVPNREAE